MNHTAPHEKSSHERRVDSGYSNIHSEIDTHQSIHADKYIEFFVYPHDREYHAPAKGVKPWNFTIDNITLKSERHHKAVIQFVTQEIRHHLNRDRQRWDDVSILYMSGYSPKPPWKFQVFVKPVSLLDGINPIIQGIFVPVSCDFVDSYGEKIIGRELRFFIRDSKLRLRRTEKGDLVKWQINLNGNPTKTSVITDLENRINHCALPIHIADICTQEQISNGSPPFLILAPWAVEWLSSQTFDANLCKWVPTKLLQCILSIPESACRELIDPDMEFREILPAKITLPIYTRNFKTNLFDSEYTVATVQPKGACRLRCGYSHR